MGAAKNSAGIIYGLKIHIKITSDGSRHAHRTQDARTDRRCGIGVGGKGRNFKFNRQRFICLRRAGDGCRDAFDFPRVIIGGIEIEDRKGEVGANNRDVGITQHHRIADEIVFRD